MSPTEHLYHELLLRAGYRYSDLLYRNWDLALGMVGEKEWRSVQCLYEDSRVNLQMAAKEDLDAHRFQCQNPDCCREV